MDYSAQHTFTNITQLNPILGGSLVNSVSDGTLLNFSNIITNTTASNLSTNFSNAGNFILTTYNTIMTDASLQGTHNSMIDGFPTSPIPNTDSAISNTDFVGNKRKQFVINEALISQKNQAIID